MPSVGFGVKTRSINHLAVLDLFILLVLNFGSFCSVLVAFRTTLDAILVVLGNLVSTALSGGVYEMIFVSPFREGVEDAVQVRSSIVSVLRGNATEAAALCQCIWRKSRDKIRLGVVGALRTEQSTESFSGRVTYASGQCKPLSKGQLSFRGLELAGRVKSSLLVYTQLLHEKL